MKRKVLSSLIQWANRVNNTSGFKHIGLTSIVIMMFCSLNVSAQMTTVFEENFNWGGQYTFKGGEPEMTWHTSFTQASNDKIIAYGTSTARSLQIYYQTDATDSGKSYLYGSLSTFLPLFKQQLNQNVADVVWSFNARNSKTSYAPHINGLLEFGENNYAQLMVMVASDDDLLDVNTCGYAVLLTRNGSGTTVFKLVRFQSGLNTTENMTTLVQSAEGVVASTNYASIKVVYAPATDTWSLFVRDNGSTAGTDGLKNPLLEDEVNGYYTTIGSAVDNTHTSVEMTTCAFFYNHGYKGTAGSSKAVFDDFAVRVAATALSTDANLSDLSVSLDEETFNTLTLFESSRTTYQYFLTKGHTIPTVSATKNDPAAPDPVIVQAINLQGTEAERTATVTMTAEDDSYVKTYTIEFIETDNIYQSGMGDANGTTSGGASADYIPEGWSHLNMYFSGVVADGNNKFEGSACVRVGLSATIATLTMPSMTGIGTLRFFARKYEEGVIGNIKVLMQKDGGDWNEVTDLGDIENLTYQEFIVPINQVANDSMLIRLEVTKNGDTFSSRGYFFDDISYSDPDFGTSTQLTKNSNYFIRNVVNGLVLNTTYAKVAIYNVSGILLQQAQVEGSREFSNLSSGIYFIHITDKNESYTVKHLID